MIRFILILKFLFFEFFNLSNFILIFYDVLNLSQDTLKRIKLLLLLLLRQIHLLSHMHQDIKLFRLRVQKLGVLFSLIIIIILHQIENEFVRLNYKAVGKPKNPNKNPFYYKLEAHFLVTNPFAWEDNNIDNVGAGQKYKINDKKQAHNDREKR